MKTTAGRRKGFRSWFVEPYKQVRLGLMFLCLNLLYATLVFSVFGYYVWDIYAAVSQYFALTSGEETTTFVKFQTPIIAGLVLTVTFIITTILMSVRYTHRIYGPLVSINRHLDEMLKGRPPGHIQLREGDQLGELVDKINLLSELQNTDQRGGPLVAIHRFLDEVKQGKNPDPIKLRDEDPFQELASKINDAFAKSK